LKCDKVRCKIEQERKLVNHEDLGSWKVDSFFWNVKNEMQIMEAMNKRDVDSFFLFYLARWKVKRDEKNWAK
jgi:hypothetical protein